MISSNFPGEIQVASTNRNWKTGNWMVEWEELGLEQEAMQGGAIAGLK